jgi:signal transduction histidine kinase
MRTKNYHIAAGLTMVIATYIVTVLLYSAGGVKAPGIFWLTAIPITGLILFGRQAGLASSVGMSVIFVVFWFLDRHYVGPNIVRDLNIYEQEKSVNVICFLCYSLLITYYFKKNQDDANEAIINHRKETENFLRILIHDVANPATFIQFGLEELKNPSLSQRDREFIHMRMDKNIDNIISILQQVRQIKALKDGKIDLEFQPVDTAKMLHDIIDVYTPKILEKSLKININAKLPYRAWADKVILQNVVLTNIISNAIKFSPSQSEITIGLSHEDNHLVIHVQDQGIGIPLHIQKKIFDLTANTSRTGTSGEKGTGYGLPLALEYVRKMNGSITIHSTEDANSDCGPGTIVMLKIPRDNDCPVTMEAEN